MMLENAVARISEACAELVPASPAGMEPPPGGSWGVRELEPGLYELWVNSLLWWRGDSVDRDFFPALSERLRMLREGGAEVVIDHDAFRRQFIFTIDMRDGASDGVKFRRPVEKVFGEAQKAKAREPKLREER